MTTKPTYFVNAAELRRWFAANHAKTAELWLGYYKKGSGVASVTYAEAVDEALCVGWIDGVVNSIDDARYMQRFTPRRKGSIWSNVNIAKVKRLIDEGRMKAPGLAAYEARTAARTGVYSFERQEAAKLPPAALKQFKANAKAWSFFQAQAPWYQRTATHLVISAKREETRAKRLATLIADSAAGRRLNQLTSPKKK